MDLLFLRRHAWSLGDAGFVPSSQCSGQSHFLLPSMKPSWRRHDRSALSSRGLLRCTCVWGLQQSGVLNSFWALLAQDGLCTGKGCSHPRGDPRQLLAGPARPGLSPWMQRGSPPTPLSRISEYCLARQCVGVGHYDFTFRIPLLWPQWSRTDIWWPCHCSRNSKAATEMMPVWHLTFAACRED